MSWDEVTPPDEEREFLQKIKTTETSNPNIKVVQQSIIKPGPRAWKSASLLHIFDPKTGEYKHTQLSLATYSKTVGAGYDFDNPTAKWYCSDEEIERLKVFLEMAPDTTDSGEHTIISVPSSATDVITALSSAVSRGSLSPAGIAEILSAIASNPDLLSNLPDISGSDYRQFLASRLLTSQRREAVEQLSMAIESHATEDVFQKIISENWWMLGGMYTRLIPRREWTDEEILDLLLQSADGYFDLVELKRSNANVFVRNRDVLSVSSEVNNAVNQAAHYISEIESVRDHLSRRYGIDLYKLKAKVIIGKIDSSDPSATDMRQSLRRYNSHLHRIEVITYDQLVQIARSAVEIPSSSGGNGETGSR